MGQFDSYGADKFPPLPRSSPNPGFHSDTPAWAIHLFAKLESHITRTIMTAKDDLLAAAAALIKEAQDDFTVLINKINDANQAGDNNPDIAAAAASLQQSTADLHTRFEAAVNPPVDPAKT